MIFVKFEFYLEPMYKECVCIQMVYKELNSLYIRYSLYFYITNNYLNFVYKNLICSPPHYVVYPRKQWYSQILKYAPIKGCSNLNNNSNSNTKNKK